MLWHTLNSASYLLTNPLPLHCCLNLHFRRLLSNVAGTALCEPQRTLLLTRLVYKHIYMFKGISGPKQTKALRA